MKARAAWLILCGVTAITLVGVPMWIQRVERRAAAHTHMARGRNAAVQGDWVRAAREFRMVVDLEPGSDAAWLMLADATFRTGRLEEALQYVRRVPSQSPNGAAARLLEGTLAISTGEALLGEALLRECLALDSKSIDARRRLVYLYGITLRRAELRRVLWELHGLGATNAADLVLLSGTSFIVWNAKEILPTIERFANRDAKDAAARVALGYYRRKQNDLDGARRDLVEACRLAPSDRDARVALLECLFDQDDVATATRVLEYLPLEWQSDARFSYFRGRQAERSGDQDRAVQYYRAVAAEDPEHREAQYRLGQLLVEAGRRDDADGYLVRARMLADREILLGTLMDSRDPARYAPEIARIERDLGHVRLAEAWFSEAARLNPYNEELRAEVSEFAVRHGRAVAASGRSGPSP